METNNLGEHIKDARIERGLSLRQLASEAEVDYSWLSKVERGIYAAPDPRYLDRLAQVLKLETADLFAMAGYGVNRGLPAFAPYLRAKYDLPTEAVDQLAAEFERINQQYQSEKDGAA
jgi:transcriptional regulator with XRE-family HTH domain